MKIIGFDFGTTNSLISIVHGNRPINYLDIEERPIPSVVCYEGTRKIIGREAKERLEQAGLGVQGNIVRSPKMYLGKDSVFVEGAEKSPVDIVADVVRYVFHQAQRDSLGPISGAVVTIPVDMDGHRRRALRDAFRLAGLRIVQFVHEPLAALYGLFRDRDVPTLLRRYDNKLILVFDWGGGTLDLTLCRPMDDMVVQLMNDGTDEVGGDVFDETIMNCILQNVRSKRGIDESVGIQPEAKSRLMVLCERAKIDLSFRSNVEIFVSSFFDSVEGEFDYSLSQIELERIVGPLLDKGFRRIERILENAGYTREQVALCIATGGMSNMPAVKRRLHEWFGPERVEVPDSAATLIAEGAAWIAMDKTGLNLAKNIELSLARNSYLPIVKAGTKMPKEGDVNKIDSFHLYCTDPRDGVAKFQICAPKRAGNTVLPSEPRTQLAIATVKVDKEARAFQERLELDVQIDDNLILKAHARSLNFMDEDRCEVHNLEFGLRFPQGARSPKSDNNLNETADLQGEKPSLGALSVRSNISARKDLSLVPGEFLFQYNPGYFDVRRNPPEHQDQEKLYYQPCSMCGRASNDPACQCSALGRAKY